MTVNGQGRLAQTAPEPAAPAAPAAPAEPRLPATPRLDEVVAVAEALVPLLGGAAVSRIAISAGTVSWEIETAVPPAAPAGAVAPAGAAPALVAEAAPGGSTQGAAAPAQPAAPSGHEVTSPLVGVFYRAKSPGSPPFVEPGDRVSVGQQLAIVEAMKMMNEVVADRAGTVRQIHPSDGSVVEFGEPLVTIEVDR